MDVLAVEMTPNPNAKKFVLAAPISAERASFFNAAAAKGNSLAESLFAIEGVAGVMWLHDFLTISKSPTASWTKLTPAVKKTLKSLPTPA